MTEILDLAQRSVSKIGVGLQRSASGLYQEARRQRNNVTRFVIQAKNKDCLIVISVSATPQGGNGERFGNRRVILSCFVVELDFVGFGARKGKLNIGRCFGNTNADALSRRRLPVGIADVEHHFFRAAHKRGTATRKGECRKRKRGKRSAVRRNNVIVIRGVLCGKIDQCQGRSNRQTACKEQGCLLAYRRHFCIEAEGDRSRTAHNNRQRVRQQARQSRGVKVTVCHNGTNPRFSHVLADFGQQEQKCHTVHIQPNRWVL